MTYRMNTNLTKLLRIKYPIIQAPIGSVTNPSLASEVSNAGGLGFLALSWQSLDACREAIRKTKALTDKPFGINLVLDKNQDERVALCLEENVDILSFFWGDSTAYIPTLKEKGVTICQTVGSVADAKRYEEQVDVIFAQGWEAGGHVWGEVTSLVLIQALAQAIKIPIVACGGFVNGKGLVAALSLGASGICMGTRFLMSYEAAIEDEYANIIAQASENDTIYLRNLFNIGWDNAPHRVIKNSTVYEWLKADKPEPNQRPHEGDIIGKTPKNEDISLYSDHNPILNTKGDLEKMALYAGQSAGLIDKREKAKVIVKSIMQEAYDKIEGMKRITSNVKGVFRKKTI